MSNLEVDYSRIPHPSAAILISLSVPVWLVVLSDQLPVIALVSSYLTN